MPIPYAPWREPDLSVRLCPVCGLPIAPTPSDTQAALAYAEHYAEAHDSHDPLEFLP